MAGAGRQELYAEFGGLTSCKVATCKLNLLYFFEDGASTTILEKFYILTTMYMIIFLI